MPCHTEGLSPQPEPKAFRLFPLSPRSKLLRRNLYFSPPQRTNFPGPRYKLPRRSRQNNFSGLEIYFRGTEIYFKGFEIYFQATEKVSLRGATDMSLQGKEIVSAGERT